MKSCCTQSGAGSGLGTHNPLASCCPACGTRTALARPRLPASRAVVFLMALLDLEGPQHRNSFLLQDVCPGHALGHVPGEGRGAACTWLAAGRLGQALPLHLWSTDSCRNARAEPSGSFLAAVTAAPAGSTVPDL